MNGSIEPVAFFVNLTGRQAQRSASIPEQWFRVLKDGKDIGYTYVVEEEAGGIPHLKHQTGDKEVGCRSTEQERDEPAECARRHDILIGVRSRMILEATRADKTRGPVQTDSESWLFVAADRRHEDWTRAVVIDDGKSTASSSTRKNSAPVIGI